MMCVQNENGGENYSPSEDPGVKSVATIYNYYKKFSYSTIVMGASFRNTGEIMELCGCDRLTISPGLLDELRSSDGGSITGGCKLDAGRAGEGYPGEKVRMDEETFRWMMNDDAMATEKLAEGIRGFAKDIEKLEKVLEEKMEK